MAERDNKNEKEKEAEPVPVLVSSDPELHQLTELCIQAQEFAKDDFWTGSISALASLHAQIENELARVEQRAPVILVKCASRCMGMLSAAIVMRGRAKEEIEAAKQQAYDDARALHNALR